MQLDKDKKIKGVQLVLLHAFIISLLSKDLSFENWNIYF